MSGRKASWVATCTHIRSPGVRGFIRGPAGSGSHNPGESAWGGYAGTAFWIDPREDMTVVFLTQLIPSSAYPIRRELRVLTYQALIE